MSEELNAKVRQVIADKLNVSLDKVVDGARFIEDLGADSLDNVELVMQLEEEFGVEIPDDDAAKIITVQDAINFIQNNKK